MKEQILSHLDNPGQLEKLYRSNKTGFKQEFSSIYPQLSGTALADFWHARLHYEAEDVFWRFNREFLFVVIAALVAGILVKLPAIFPISEAFYYPRNLSFFVLPPLMAYFAWRNKMPEYSAGIIAGITPFAWYTLMPCPTTRVTPLRSPAFTCLCCCGYC
ncbi:hypothetical protein [Pontibacter sp. BAB1700]|uniref:hypothetical protein n=1 Tax=Pontibacter sp. BAB1700 TaxID=1144253 RepID=UPI00031A6C45